MFPLKKDNSDLFHTQPDFGPKHIKKSTDLVVGKRYVIKVKKGADEEFMLQSKPFKNGTSLWIRVLVNGQTELMSLTDLGVVPYEGGLWSRARHVEAR